MFGHRSETNFASFPIIMLPNIIPTYGQPINTFIPALETSDKQSSFKIWSMMRKNGIDPTLLRIIPWNNNHSNTPQAEPYVDQNLKRKFNEE